MSKRAREAVNKATKGKIFEGEGFEIIAIQILYLA